jgi:hypothetical protein
VSGVAEDSGLLGCDAVWVVADVSKDSSASIFRCEAVKVSGCLTIHPAVRRHIPEDLHPGVNCRQTLTTNESKFYANGQSSGNKTRTYEPPEG